MSSTTTDRRQEIADLNRDIHKVHQRLAKTTDFELQLAYNKLLKLLKHWRRRGY